MLRELTTTLMLVMATSQSRTLRQPSVDKRLKLMHDAFLQHTRIQHLSPQPLQFKNYDQPHSNLGNPQV